MNEDVKKILDYVIIQEDLSASFEASAIEKNNIYGSVIHGVETTAYQRIRYFIEDMIQGKEI